MVVAVAAMRMMQVSFDQIIDMVAMRDGFMTAAGAVDMSAIVGAAVVLGGAGRRVGGRQADGVLIDVALMQVVQVTVMQIVDMIVVLDGGMTAASLMLMRMFRVSDTR